MVRCTTSSKCFELTINLHQNVKRMASRSLITIAFDDLGKRQQRVEILNRHAVAPLPQFGGKILALKKNQTI